jgi:hypothetical protein
VKLRNDFWKCGCNIQSCDLDRCDECCVSQFYGDDATNIELVVAWLLADDDRRLELANASKPTIAGTYTVYRHYRGQPCNSKRRTIAVEEVEIAEPHEAENQYFDWCLWEPLD